MLQKAGRLKLNECCMEQLLFS